MKAHVMTSEGKNEKYKDLLMAEKLTEDFAKVVDPNYSEDCDYYLCTNEVGMFVVKEDRSTGSMEELGINAETLPRIPNEGYSEKEVKEISEMSSTTGENKLSLFWRLCLNPWPAFVLLILLMIAGIISLNINN